MRRGRRSPGRGGGGCRELWAAVQSVPQCRGQTPFAEELVTSPEQGVQSLQPEPCGAPFPQALGPAKLGRGLLCGPTGQEAGRGWGDLR